MNFALKTFATGRTIQLLILILITTITLTSQSISSSACLIFFPVIVLFFISIIGGRLTLLSAFSAGFAYMVLPEAIQSEELLITQWGASNVKTGYRVLVLSFVAVCVGFLILRNKFARQKQTLEPVIKNEITLRLAWLFFLILEIAIVALFIPFIINGLTTGRGGELAFDVGFFGYFLIAIQYVTISFWGYYYSRKNQKMISLIKAIIVSAPILIIGIASGTRFYLCFMLICLLLPWIRVLNLKKLVWIIAGVFAVIIVFSSMKATRYSGFEFLSISQALGIEEKIDQNVKSHPMITIAKMGSSEGLVRNMAMIDLYTDTYGYTYGKSIGFLGIFWIPRVIWPDKPNQLDYWLIREYEDERGFGSRYSTASSFCGELFMDFGYFCVFFCFVLGMLLAKMDDYIERNITRGDFFSVTLSGLCFGWSLFIVRSFLTSSYQLILGCAIAYLVSKTIFRETKLKKELVFASRRN